MRLLTALLFWTWVGALVLLGGSGIFTGEWELRLVYGIDLASMSPMEQAGLLNQFRFLKAVEFGFGFFCILFRREIRRVPLFNRLFLSIVFLGASARALAIALDGWPHWTFTGITLLELLTGIVLALDSRRTLERA